MTNEDITNVGLTEETHAMLQKMKKDGIFNEMLDGYRFGIAFAIARELIPPENLKIHTFLSVSSLDKDGSLRSLIIELFPESADKPYMMAQGLAEAGLVELGRRYEFDQLHFSEIIKTINEGIKK